MSLSAIVLAAVFAAYIFLGRSLTRMVNYQQQENQSRRALRHFTQDVGAASALTTASSTVLGLTKPTASGTTSVTYTYTPATSGGTFTRAENAATLTLLSNLSSLTLTYFNEAGSTVSSGTQSIKSVELAFTSNVGDANNNTRSSYSSVSPRVLLRNKQLLQ